MKRSLIIKNAKFNSKTSDKVIRVKELDDEYAIIETVVYDGTRYKPVPDSQRVVEIASIQKSYYCGDASPAAARMQKNTVLESRRNPGNFVRITKVSDDDITVKSVYQRSGAFTFIEGSTRVVKLASLMVGYKEVK